MTDTELEEKFRSLAHGQMTAQHADRLLDRLWNLDRLDDIGELL